MQDFVTVYLWSSEGASLEMSTDAFCLPKKRIRILIKRILFRISSSIRTLNSLHPREFSSTMLPKVIFNRFEISLFSTNHPNQTNYNEIIQNTKEFKHKLIIESPFMRTVWSNNYFKICNEIRTSLELTPLLLNMSTLDVIV